MKKIFITYGDQGYEAAKNKICEEARNTGEFDSIIAFGREDLSKELLSSDIINQKRGGGLWSWKPDVILKTMEESDDDDIIVYCDAGCSLYPSKEWKMFWKILQGHDIITQRIFRQTECWTRKEILEKFSDNGPLWRKCFQYQATPIFKNTEFTRMFLKEWRDLMINEPHLVMDVTKEEMSNQHRAFIENRHDQSLYSALIYKYLVSEKYRSYIYTQWEHIEDYDFIFKQAIRATRLRKGEDENVKLMYKKGYRRLIKDYIAKPFFYIPAQAFLFRMNKLLIAKDNIYHRHK